MDREQQITALDLFEVLAFATPRIPGHYREAALSFIAFHRAELAKAHTESRPRRIELFNGLAYWQIKADDDVIASIPKGPLGLRAIHLILSAYQGDSRVVHPVHEVFEILGFTAPQYPASALQKQLKRARDVIACAGAADFADLVQDTISISNARNLVIYTPNDVEVVCTTAVLERSCEDSA